MHFRKESPVTHTSQSLSGNKKELFRLTWPLFLEMVLFTVIGSVDTLMLSGYADDAVGAVGVVNQIIFLFQVISNIITTGVGILCAQYIGAGKTTEEKQPLILGALLVNGLLGILFSVSAALFADQFLLAMNVTGSLFLHGKQYFTIVGSFLFVQMVTVTFTTVIRSHGHTRATMVFSLLMNLINLVLNYILIYGKLGVPAMGAAGAAVATVISKCVSCILSGGYLLLKVLPGISLRPQWQQMRRTMKTVLAYGAPAAGEQISYMLSKLVITAMITSLGSIAVNTYSYTNTVIHFVYLFSSSLGQCTAIIIGWEVGKKALDAAKSLCMFSVRCSFAISMAIVSLLILVRNPIMDIFTDNPQIIALGGSLIIADFLLEIGRSRNLVLVSALRAAGDVRFPLYIGLFSMWLFGVGASWLLGIRMGWGLVGIWIAAGLDECFRAVGMQIRWQKGIWAKKYSE